MKVLLVSSGSGSRGGGEIYLRFLAQGLRAANIDVVVLIPSDPAMDELAHTFDGIAHVMRAQWRPTYQRRFRNIAAASDITQIAQIAALFREVAPDVVHINQQVAEDGLDLIKAAQSAGLPWLSTIHVAHSAKALGAQLGVVRDLVTSATLRAAKGIHVLVSHQSKAQLTARLKRGPFESVVVHNGVPSMDHAAQANARTAARRDWLADENSIVIGVVGRIEDQKNPRAIIDYTRHLLPDGPLVKRVWIGDGTMRADLETYARTQAVPLHIDGWRSDAQLRMAGFDIFMLPSKFEGLPLALLEAMRAGLVVVSSKTDGTPEAIDHGRTGFLCSTAEDWRTTLERLVRDADMRKAVGLAAKDDADRRFSLEAMAHATLEQYKAAILRAKVPPPR
jgi:glycosyltransferase involved in cell wall biosynthesis